MKTHPHHPMSGCAHGATTDPDICGLTKREWYVGKLLGTAIWQNGQTPSKEFVYWAIQTADLAIEMMNQNV